MEMGDLIVENNKLIRTANGRSDLKRTIVTFLGYISLLFILTSCLFPKLGVNNPRKPGKPPQFSQETILLGELTSYRTCFKVRYYDLSVQVFPEDETLKGEVLIYAKAVESFDTLQIDLDDQFVITKLEDVATQKTLSYSRKHRAVFIQRPSGAGEEFELKIAYEGKPIKAKKPPWVGGFVWKKDKFSKSPWIAVACESEGASVWWPLKDHTSEEPDSIRLHYTVPKGLVAVGNGQLEGRKVWTQKKGNKSQEVETFDWFVSYPINTYNVTFYAGKLVPLSSKFKSISGKIIDINHYVLEPNLEKAKKHFEQLEDILWRFEKLFGPYPWQRDGFKFIESPYEGMEHQSAIAYGNGYKNEIFGKIDYIILHETAHEWWGNSITAKDLAHVWLQEGFATYAEALYMEQRDGKDGYETEMFFNSLSNDNKYPVVGIEGRRWFHFKKNADVYSKGACILHTLRKQINDDSVFFNVIKTFYTKYQYQIVESDDFIKVVNEVTGTDYQWFFDHYLYDNEVPELEYAVTRDGKMMYRWSNTKENFDKLTLQIQTEHGISTVCPSNKMKEFKIPNAVGFPGAYSYAYFSQDKYVAFRENKKMLKLK